MLLTRMATTFLLLSLAACSSEQPASPVEQKKVAPLPVGYDFEGIWIGQTESDLLSLMPALAQFTCLIGHGEDEGVLVSSDARVNEQHRKIGEACGFHKAGDFIFYGLAVEQPSRPKLFVTVVDGQVDAMVVLYSGDKNEAQSMLNPLYSHYGEPDDVLNLSKGSVLYSWKKVPHRFISAFLEFGTIPETALVEIIVSNTEGTESAEGAAAEVLDAD